MQHPISNPFVIQTSTDTEVLYHASHFSISQCMGKYLEVNSHAEVCAHPTPALSSHTEDTVFTLAHFVGAILLMFVLK